LDVAMDELSQIYNHSASNEFREYYEMHMNQLDNIITLINKLKWASKNIHAYRGLRATLT
jgi:hypothetical protein